MSLYAETKNISEEKQILLQITSILFGLVFFAFFEESLLGGPQNETILFAALTFLGVIIFVFIAPFISDLRQNKLSQERGRAQLFAEKFNDAIESFNVVIKVKPVLAYLYLLRGIAQSIMVDYLGAEQDYNKAIEYKSNYTDA